MLKADSLQFSYDGNQNVLNNISFELPPGSHLSLMGASGSGKSTLLKLLFGTLLPDQGSVSWEGRRLRGPFENLMPGNKGFHYVAQDFDLIPFIRVIEYLRMYQDPHEVETEQHRILELLELVQLQSYAQTEVQHLSMGQKQRIALIKALLGKPKVLLLDEPFTHVDVYQKNYLRLRIFPYLKDRGVTVVNATHEGQDVLPFADYVLILKKGEAAAFGPTKEIYQRPGNYYIASLFGLVNQVRGKDFSPGDYQGTSLVYAEEIEVEGAPARTGYMSAIVRVERSFFQGSRYLLELRTQAGHLLYAYASGTKKRGASLQVALPFDLYRDRFVPED